MIFILATVEVQPGKREEFLTLFKRLVPKVLAEEGCIEYAPMVDLPTQIGGQPPERRDALVVVEKWADLAAVERHLAAPHMAEFREASKSLRAGITLHILRPA